MDLVNSHLPMIVRMSPKGWVNQEITNEFVQSVSAPFNKRLLVWDAFHRHTSDDTKNKCRQSKIQMAVIPGGCTGVIQAPDVSWNAPFKAKYREMYEEWMSEGEMLYTQAGNFSVK